MSAMGETPPVVYSPHPDATLEGELNALADIYRFVLFESRGSQGGKTAIAAPDDRKGRKHDPANASICPS
jgi:hypothetical protein